MTTVVTTDNAALWQDAQKWTDTFYLSLQDGALRRERRSRGLTLSVFHARSGVNRHHLSRIETRNSARVYVDTARRLVRGLAGDGASEEECGRLLRALCIIDGGPE